MLSFAIATLSLSKSDSCAFDKGNYQDSGCCSVPETGGVCGIVDVPDFRSGLWSADTVTKVYSWAANPAIMNTEGTYGNDATHFVTDDLEMLDALVNFKDASDFVAKYPHRVPTNGALVIHTAVNIIMEVTKLSTNTNVKTGGCQSSYATVNELAEWTGGDTIPDKTQVVSYVFPCDVASNLMNTTEMSYVTLPYAHPGAVDLSSIWNTKMSVIKSPLPGLIGMSSWEDIRQATGKSKLVVTINNCWCPYTFASLTPASLGAFDVPCRDGVNSNAIRFKDDAAYVVVYSDRPFGAWNKGYSPETAPTWSQKNGVCVNYANNDYEMTFDAAYNLYSAVKPIMINGTRLTPSMPFTPVGMPVIGSPSSFVIDADAKTMDTRSMYYDADNFCTEGHATAAQLRLHKSLGRDIEREMAYLVGSRGSVV